MKALKKYFPLSLMMIIIMGSCSPKVSNQKIDTLETQQALLQKTTELNNLKLDLEKNIQKQASLTSDVEKANRAVAASGKVDAVSDLAGSDAKKAKKLNAQLQDVNKKISHLRRNIEKKEKELNELKARVEFVPST
jgi:chromosome segregation ATPase